MEPTPKKKDLMVSEDVASLKKNINKTVKSNKCYQCDYAFSKASDLKRHYEIHSGEKPNKCNRCVYASSYARDLRTHLKTHSGEKPNKCNQCDYASNDASNLKRHMLKHKWEHPRQMHPLGQTIYKSYLSLNVLINMNAQIWTNGTCLLLPMSSISIKNSFVRSKHKKMPQSLGIYTTGCVNQIQPSGWN